jgi:hypothetical protein
MRARHRRLGLLIAALLLAAAASCVGPGLEPPHHDNLSEAPGPGVDDRGGRQDGGAATPPPIQPNGPGSLDMSGDRPGQDGDGAPIIGTPEGEMDAGGP